MRRHLKRKLIVPIVFCALTIASLSVSTFAWFSTQRTATIGVWKMHVQKGLTNQVKYFYRNFDTPSSSFAGYPDIRQNGSDPSKAVTVSSYASDFITVPGGKFSSQGPLDISHLTPGYCHTFSFEIASNAGRDIALEISASFLSPESTTKRIYDGGTTTSGITLGSAIDIYTKGYVLSEDDVANTAYANNFVKDYMKGLPEDHFTYNDVRDAAVPSCLLFHGTIPANSSFLLFLTLEFTDLPETYYSYQSTSGGYSYYARSTSGSSDCYQGQTFSLTDIFITNPDE